MIKSGQMVLKGVNRVHNDKIGSNGLERSHWVHNSLENHRVKWS